jgi:hypothetical protein
VSQAAARPNDEVEGDGYGRYEERQAHGARAFGIGDAFSEDIPARGRERLGEHDRERKEEEEGEEAQGGSRDEEFGSRSYPSLRLPFGGGSTTWRPLIAREEQERQPRSMAAAIRGGSPASCCSSFVTMRRGVAALGLHAGHVAGDEDDRAVFPEAPRECEGEAGEGAAEGEDGEERRGRRRPAFSRLPGSRPPPPVGLEVLQGRAGPYVP